MWPVTGAYLDAIAEAGERQGSREFIEANPEMFAHLTEG